MDRVAIHKLMEMLNLGKIADRDTWVNSECPFAFWTHDEGVSHRNSFGISIGETSYFHCFSCQKSGDIRSLPSVLFLLSGKDWTNLRKFIYEHEKIKLIKDNDLDIEPPKPIDENIFNEFEPLPSYRGLTQKTITEWGLKYDKKNKRVIIPIRDKFGQLIAIKGRAILRNIEPKYLLYKDSSEPKKYGIWFGMHYPLIPNRLLVIVEGELDCILLKQTGLVHNVWAAMGAGITQQQIKTLSNITNPVGFFLDNDKAGIQLKERLHRKLKGLMPHYEITNYYQCKDAGEAVETGKIGMVLTSFKRKIS